MGQALCDGRNDDVHQAFVVYDGRRFVAVTSRPSRRRIGLAMARGSGRRAGWLGRVQGSLQARHRGFEADPPGLVPQATQLGDNPIVAFTPTVSRQRAPSRNVEVAPHQGLRARVFRQRCGIPLDTIPTLPIQAHLHGITKKIEMVVTGAAFTEYFLTLC